MNENNDISNIENKPAINEQNTLPLSSPENAQKILDSISKGESVELNVDKQILLNNFNTFMLAEAYSQLPTIIKLHELQTKCLDMYYKQVNELLDEEDVNVFLLDKIITTINNSIDRCNNIILKLGLNSDITDQLMIKHIDNSQHLAVYQSQISQQKVLDVVNKILNGNYNVEDVDNVNE